MKIKKSVIYRVFLAITAFYYLGIVQYLSRFLLSGPEKGNFEEIAAGNPINVLAGFVILSFCILIFIKEFKNLREGVIFETWPVLLIFAYLFFSITWSEVPQVSLKRTIALSIMFLSAYLLIYIFKFESLLKFVFYGIVITIILGIFDTYLQGRSIVIGVGDQHSGLIGIFGDKNAAARVYAYGFILGFALRLYKSKVGLASLGVVLLALASSHSASAIIAAFLGAGIIWSLKISKQDKKDKNVLTFGLLVLVYVLFGLLINYLYEYLLVLLNRDPNLTNRAIIWELLTPKLEENFSFGYGYGAFWASSAVEGFVERWGFIANAHSGYFEIILHGGVVLLGLFTALIAVFFRSAISLYISPRTRGLEIVCVAIFCVQAVLNYIAYIYLNQTTFDTFLFALLFFFVMREHRNYRLASISPSVIPIMKENEFSKLQH